MSDHIQGKKGAPFVNARWWVRRLQLGRYSTRTGPSVSASSTSRLSEPRPPRRAPKLWAGTGSSAQKQKHADAANAAKSYGYLEARHGIPRIRCSDTLQSAPLLLVPDCVAPSASVLASRLATEGPVFTTQSGGASSIAGLAFVTAESGGR